jgi:ABC-type spermidine/putrescine transport system permease subunit I
MRKGIEVEVNLWIVARSLLAALIVTAAALALGFPYA